MRQLPSRLLPAAPTRPEDTAAAIRLIIARREPDQDALLAALGLAPEPAQRTPRRCSPSQAVNGPGRRRPLPDRHGPRPGHLTHDEIAWMLAHG